MGLKSWKADGTFGLETHPGCNLLEQMKPPIKTAHEEKAAEDRALGPLMSFVLAQKYM